MKKILFYGALLSALSMFAEQANSQNNIFHKNIMAQYHLFNNNIPEAEYWYRQLEPKKQEPWFYLGYVPFLESSGKFQEIINLIPFLDTHFKQNFEIQSAIARALEKTGKADQAQARMIQLNNLDKTNQELAFKVAQVYIERQEPENALKVIHNLLNNSARKPNNFIFHFLEAQIYLLLGNKEEAYKTIKTCIDTYPKFDKGWLLYAMLEEQMGKIAQAIKGYTSFLETTSEVNKDIEQHLISLAVKQKIGDNLDRAPHAKDCISQALKSFEKREYKAAIEQLDICLSQKSGNSKQANLTKIDILIAQKNYDKALDELLKLCLSDQKNELWLKTIHLLHTHTINHKKIAKTFEVIAKKQPDNIYAWLYLADIQLRHKQLSEALAALKKAYALASNDFLKVSIIYQQSLIYYELKQFPSLKKVLHESEKLTYVYPPLLNLHAYYYATHGKQLAKAQALSETALSHDPHNPHFLDTQALILYKQKQYDAALAILKPLAQHHVQDAIILKHLGKLLYKMGDHSMAQNYISQAEKHALSRQEKLKLHALIARWNTNT